MSDLVLAAAPRPGVLLLTLNRPEARNALNLALRQALADALEAAAADASVRAVVLTGDDRAFAAGADIKAIAEATPQEMKDSPLTAVWGTVARFPKPLIMAVRGVALGAGCELAMHGDIIVAGDKALFGQPEIRVGVMPGAGGISRLIRLVGRTRAMRMVMTGEAIPGRTAFEWGLASDAVPDEQVLEKALDYAGRIADLPAGALAKIKAVGLASTDMPLDAALTLERESFSSLFGTPDQREGMAAFIEKRPPTFNRH